MAQGSSKKKGKIKGGRPAPNGHGLPSAGSSEVVELLDVKEFEIELIVPMAKGSSKKKGKNNKGGAPASKGDASESADSSKVIAEELPALDLSQSKQVAIPNSKNDDRISELPDNVKGLILSNLPTRCAVATAVLSKAWRHAWIGVIDLDFNDLPSSVTSENKIIFSEEQYVRFTHYVNRILLLHDAQFLRRLHLEMYDCFDAIHVYEWMLVISRLQVQYLCCISRNFHVGLIKVPHYIFLHKPLLVVLKLEGFRLYLPPAFYLPCLQTFSLTNAVLCDIYTDDPWMRFLSNCPVLEYLNIEHCEGLEKLSVCSPSIKILRVVLETDPQIEILIETPNLEVLYLSLGIIRSEVNDLSSLVEATLDVWTSSDTWIELLRKICCTKTLVLHQIILDGSTASMRSPMFQNLTHMEVGFTAWSVVLQIIRNAPKLASFTIHKLMFDWPDRKPSIKDIPLERIEYLGFDVEVGLKVLGYFLRYCALLKKVIINPCSWLDPVTTSEILKKLLRLGRVSNRCKIIFVNEGDTYKSEDGDSESEGCVDSDSKSEISVDSISESEKAVDVSRNSESEKAVDVASESELKKAAAGASDGESKKAVDVASDSESKKAVDVASDSESQWEDVVSDSFAAEVLLNLRN